MDLMRLLRSLEEFLYELVGWLVFYPRTLVRILLRPGAIARYTRLELARDGAAQFQDTISPVLMLILSVVLAHALEIAFRLALPQIDSPMGRLLLDSEQGLLLTRSAFFCIYALGAALGTLRRERRPITRETLREPFSIQAFLVCPFVVLLSLSTLLMRSGEGGQAAVGAVIAIGICIWYIGARTAAYRALHGGGWAAPLFSVCVWFAMTTFLVVVLGWLMVR